MTNSFFWFAPQMWGVGTVTSLGPNLSLSNGTLSASGTVATEWSAGTVTALGANLSITSGTISATGGGGGIGTIVAASPLTGGGSGSSVAIGFETIASGDVIANISGSAGEPGGVGFSALLDAVIGSTEGDLLVRGASAWGTIAAGTSGDLLTSQGAGAVPTWAAAPAAEWNAGAVSTIGANLTLSSGTLSASGGGSSEWTAGTVSTISSDFTLVSGTLELAGSLVNPGTNAYVFGTGSTIEGVSAVGAAELIFQGGATVATGEYVLRGELPYPITISDAKTWVSGTSPSATGVAVQLIHAGTTTPVTGLSALSITTGTPNSPTTTAATGANTAVAGDTLQVNIGTVSGTITALGVHIDFTRTG